MHGKLRDSTALAVGSAVSGVLAYVFFAVTTRALGADAAPVSVLWTYWTFAAAALTFPLQHWIIRAVTAQGGESGLTRALTQVIVAVLVLSAAAGGAAWWAREALFARDDVGFPVLVALVTAGSAFVGIIRGVLSSRRLFVAVAAALVAENAVRVAAAAALVAFGVRASFAYGLTLALGQLALLCWPSALKVAARTAGTEKDSAAGASRYEAQGDRAVSALSSWAAFLGAAAGGQLIAQAVLTGGPIVLALSGGSPAQVTALFAGLALFRAPYMVAVGVLAQTTGILTRLVLVGDARSLRTIRLCLVGLTVVGSALAAVVGWALGPWLVQTIFGPAVVLTSEVSLLIAVGSGLAMSNLALTTFVMAFDRSSSVVCSWLVAAAVAGVVIALLPTASLLLTCWAFVAAEVAAFVLMLAQTSRVARTGSR